MGTFVFLGMVGGSEVVSEKVNTIIIGAGFSGLSAGIRLAQFQDSVLILEAHNVTGGLNSFYFRGGKDNLYSSGLHTVTNFRSNNRKWGFGLICRNLGIDPESFQLRPPKYPSRIITPDRDLLFDNDLEVFKASIAQDFPQEVDNLQRFLDALPKMRPDEKGFQTTSKEGLRAFFQDEELIGLLELPVYIYGGYCSGQIDFVTFCTIFRSIFIEGCGSPENVKHLLDVLAKRFKELGGTLKTRREVKRILVKEGRFVGVELSNGETIEADYCLSSAGLSETGHLVDPSGEEWGDPGDISAFETLINLPKPLDECGVKNTLLMVANQSEFDWSLPEGRQSFNHLTLSALDNYQFEETPHLHVLKIGCYHRGSVWHGLEEELYQSEKTKMEALLLEELEKLFPGLQTSEANFTESLTPRTVTHYTSHIRGTIYGGQKKTFDGTTPVENLFIVGNDQGGIGIMGALTSGIVVSNYQIILK